MDGWMDEMPTSCMWAEKRINNKDCHGYIRGGTGIVVDYVSSRCTCKKDHPVGRGGNPGREASHAQTILVKLARRK